MQNADGGRRGLRTPSPARGSGGAAHLDPVREISKHLGLLRKVGLVEARREVRWVFYSVNEDVLDAARGYLDDLRESMHRPHVADHCDEPNAG